VGEEVFLQPMVKIIVREAVPCSPWRPMVEQISTCSPGRTPHQSRRMSEGSCDPVGSPCWSRLLPGPADPWRQEPMLEQAWDSGWSNLFLKDCTPWKGPTLEQFVEDCLLWEGPTLEQGQSVRRKERQRQSDGNPHFLFPCTTGREEIQKLGGKLIQGRRDG